MRPAGKALRSENIGPRAASLSSSTGASTSGTTARPPPGATPGRPTARWGSARFGSRPTSTSSTCISSSRASRPSREWTARCVWRLTRTAASRRVGRSTTCRVPTSSSCSHRCIAWARPRSGPASTCSWRCHGRTDRGPRPTTLDSSRNPGTPHAVSRCAWSEGETLPASAACSPVSHGEDGSRTKRPIGATAFGAPCSPSGYPGSCHPPSRRNHTTR